MGVRLNLTDQIDAWLQSRTAFLPFGGTNFTVVSSYELRSFHFTQQFVRITPDVVS